MTMISAENKNVILDDKIQPATFQQLNLSFQMSDSFMEFEGTEDLESFIENDESCDDESQTQANITVQFRTNVEKL